MGRAEVPGDSHTATNDAGTSSERGVPTGRASRWPAGIP